MPPPRLPEPPIPPANPPPPATRGDEDPTSPTVLLQSYLRSQGTPLTGANMRTLLDAVHSGNVRIPGLMDVDTPSTDPGVGGKGNVAGKIETAPSRTGIVNASGDARPPDARIHPSTSASANATGGGGDSSALYMIPLGAAIAGGSAGLGYYLGRRGGGGGTVPAPGASVPPPVDPGAAGPNDVIDSSLPPEGNRFNVNEPPPPDPLDAALSRATEPARVAPFRGQVGGPGLVSPVPAAPDITAPNVGGPQFTVAPPPQVSTSPTLRGPGTPPMPPGTVPPVRRPYVPSARMRGLFIR